MSLNKVILIGFVGKEPEIRYLDKENSVAQFSLATTERGFTLANGNEIPDSTDWHNIVAFGEHAKFVEKWVKKGSSLHIEGRIRYRSYVDKQSITRYVTEIVADRLNFFNMGTGKPSDEESPSNPS